MRRKPDPVVAVTETYLTNIPKGRSTPPKGEPWIGYLFTRGQRGTKDVMELHGETQAELDRAICAYIEGNHLAVVPE